MYVHVGTYTYYPYTYIYAFTDVFKGGVLVWKKKGLGSCGGPAISDLRVLTCTYLPALMESYVYGTVNYMYQ